MPENSKEDDCFDREDDFFAVVIGTGFGGAVTACRLTQALVALEEKGQRGGKRICVLERGRRYTSSDFPDLPKYPFALPDDHRWLWQSNQGLFDAREMRGCGILQAAGYGGGSLIYANVHLRASEKVFHDDWPKDINRQALDPYYDLVAAMLDIKPIDGPMRKAEVLERAAHARGVTTFRPPVAVSLADGRNPFGHEQKACQNCGACCFGCPHDAKNTLDRNYLAVVDQHPEVAEVRTLCEVVAISEPDRRNGNEMYEILYRDYTRRGRLFRTDEERRTCASPEFHRLNAQYVFVCGGSINTTQLLMRSRRAHEIWSRERDTGRSTEGLPLGLSSLSPDRSPDLGHGYFPNADGIAMVFDTKESIKPSEGPTITTAAVFKQNDDWFLVEDGGYPKDVKHLFDIAFRSSLLLDSNRFLPQASGDTALNGDGFAWPRKEPDPKSPGRAPNFVEGFAAAVAGNEFDAVIPTGFRGYFDAWWKVLRTAVDSRVEFAQVIDAVKRGLPVSPVVYRIACITEPRVFDLVRPALDRSFHIETPGMLIKQSDRMLMRWLSGRNGPIRPNILPGTRPPVGKEGGKQRLIQCWIKLLFKWIASLFGHKRAAAGKNPWECRQLLLVMGQDDRPFSLEVLKGSDSFFDELALHIEQPRAESAAADARRTLLPNLGDKAQHAATVRAAWRATTYTAEELFLRDLAKEMGGELRTNPLWTLGQVPVSSHSQGGCAMGKVTDTWGEVLNHRRLFVNDGSLFPHSVGVNPSSTIAALAERNIEHFIQTEPFIQYGLHAPRWRAPEYDNLVPEWQMRAGAGSWILEPPNVKRTDTDAKPGAKPLGIKFDEKMKGFFIWETPPENPRQATEDFFRAEIRGRLDHRPISFDLKAELDDVNAFMRDPTHDIRFTGGILVVGSCEAKVYGGSMQLLVDDGPERRRMDYEVRAAAGDVIYTLRGHKYLRDEPGFAAWADTSILFSKITEEKACCERIEGYGILRVTIDEFMFESVPSFTVTNSDGDEARNAQTLLRFMQFFMAGLANVYVPTLTQVPGFLRKRGMS